MEDTIIVCTKDKWGYGKDQQLVIDVVQDLAYAWTKTKTHKYTNVSSINYIQFISIVE